MYNVNGKFKKKSLSLSVVSKLSRYFQRFWSGLFS